MPYCKCGKQLRPQGVCPNCPKGKEGYKSKLVCSCGYEEFFKTTGDCCGEIQWTVSPETGGTTILAGGLLIAGATACGSLQVTATCPACGTSATQYVRVTDAGHWVDAGYCNSISGQYCLTFYSSWGQLVTSGQIREWARWGRSCWHEFGDPCVIIKTCSTIVPNDLTQSYPDLYGYIDLPYDVYKAKWECK